MGNETGEEPPATTAAADAGADAGGGGGGPSKKKRGADDTWRASKDEASSDEEEGGSEGGGGSGEFQRADAETLSKRRIIKARRPAGMEEGGSGSSAPGPAPAANPFANVSLTGAAPAAAPAAAAEPPKPSGGGGVLGSKFAHVNAASILAGQKSSFPAPGGFGGGFGSAAAATGEGGEPEQQQQEGSITRPGTGPGLGSAPFGFASYKLNPFAAAAASAGSAGSGGGAGGFASFPSKRKLPSELVKGSQGEGEGGEGEEGEGAGGADEDVEAEPVNATYLVPKVVPGLKDASYKPVTGEEGETCVLQLRSKLYRLTEVSPAPAPASAAADGAAASASASASSSQGPRRDWVECGVGQAKILVPQARESGGEDAAAALARVVMRREPGTSVLINARLKPPVVTAAKHADKALRLTCLDDKGQPSTFLFRFKLQDEAEQFLAELTRQLEVAGKDKTGAADAPAASGE